MGGRTFIAVLAGMFAVSVLVCPFPVWAQQAGRPVVGFLSVASSDTSPKQIDAFREGLAEAGFIEGRDVTIEYRWAQGHYDRLPGLAADLVQRQVNVIAATFGDIGIQAVKAATATIPIVFTTGSDPVRAGLVASLSHPGGNLTGVSFFTTGFIAKRLEMLLEVVPGSAPVGMLLNPDSPETKVQREDVQNAAGKLGQPLVMADARTASEIDAAFAHFADQKVKALLVSADPFYTNRREQIVALASRYHIPASYGRRDFVPIGGLMGYGTNFVDAYHKAGVYAGRILKGDKPGDLPVLEPTKFEFAINLKTAKSLGLEIPPRLYFTADEVIE